MARENALEYRFVKFYLKKKSINILHLNLRLLFWYKAMLFRFYDYVRFVTEKKFFVVWFHLE